MFRKAERKRAKLRLALAGPSGSGKTYSALLLAQGLGGKIAMIDTESGSGELYANLTEYDVCTLTPPFTPQKYIDAIKAAETARYTTVIIDSLSHAWVGPGGVLDMHDAAAKKSSSGNSWTAWREVTPKHNALIDAILQSTCHIIATMRTKTEYVQTEENGKKVVKKLGMNPVQRDGAEYEFTIFLDLDGSHNATASKDRTGLLDGQILTPSAQVGKQLLTWLDSGAEPAPQYSPAKEVKAPPQDNTNRPMEGHQKARIMAEFKRVGMNKNSQKALVDLHKNGDKVMTYAQADSMIAELASMASAEQPATA